MMISKKSLDTILIQIVLIKLGLKVNELAVGAKIPQSVITGACKGREIEENLCEAIIATINYYKDTNYKVKDIFEHVIDKYLVFE